MYYESHVTIEPVFDDQLSSLKAISSAYGFKIADLLMQKRREDKPERSKYDTFLTGRSSQFEELELRMTKLIMEIKSAGFSVWRYKIEQALIDSKERDVLRLLAE
jgi:hypothetical protein